MVPRSALLADIKITTTLRPKSGGSVRSATNNSPSNWEQFSRIARSLLQNGFPLSGCSVIAKMELAATSYRVDLELAKRPHGSCSNDCALDCTMISSDRNSAAKWK